MSAQKGSLFLLKVGDGGSPETFTTLGGLRATRFAIDNAPVDVTTKDSAGMRELLAGAGVQSMTISGSGLFTDSTAEETLRANASSGAIANYRIIAGNGDQWEGAFLITAYGRGGDYNSEETFSLTLESSGAIAFTPGP